MKYLFYIAFLIFTSTLSAQIVRVEPNPVNFNEKLTLYFKANEGNAELAGAAKIYMHHGVVTDGISSTKWTSVVGNWGKDDGVGLMTKVSDNEWKYEFTPNLHAYFNLADGTQVYRLACVFRNADGSLKGSFTPGSYGWGEVASNGDYFINLNASDYVSIDQPYQAVSYVGANETVEIKATVSATASKMIIYIDEGAGYAEVHAENNTREILYNYHPTKSIDIKIKIEAVVNGEELITEKEHVILYLKDTETAELPSSLRKGVNYNENDPSKATLVLEAPGKSFVFVVGDFTDWKPKDQYQMNKTPDGELFWLQLDGLVQGEQYVYQYWIDGEVMVADPYTNQVADPWNDPYIDADVFSNLPLYDKKEYGIASVMKIGEEAYTWSHPDVEIPAKEEMVIYELLVRDFSKEHTFKEVRERLDHLVDLRINVLELMPVNEFEGNSSWGYNSSFYFAADKYYGPANELKSLIDACHKRGIAVVIDMVLNHSYSQSPLVKMYSNGTAVAPDNPWYNVKSNFKKPDAQWGNDFNHHSDYTRAFVDSVNSFWINEFKVDGFRFDFTKGFSNTSYPVDSWGSDYDPSRISNLKRMADEIWKEKSDALVIFEHLAENSEEKVLADYGIMLWGNMHHNYSEAAMGYTENLKSDLSWAYYGQRNWNEPNLISYMESHDEERLAYNCLQYGNSSQAEHNVKNTEVAMQRLALNSVFHLPLPGPKMIWQFGEFGYDVSINTNGRVGEKPLKWNYMTEVSRKELFKTMGALNYIKQNYEEFSTSDISYSLRNTIKSYRLTSKGEHVVVVGNFDLVARNVAIEFPETGTWYNYFSRESLQVEDNIMEVELGPGEYLFYTSRELAFPEFTSKVAVKNIEFGNIEVYPNPVSRWMYVENGNERFNLKIYTMGGQMCLNKDFMFKQAVDLVHLNSGMYIYHVQADKEHQTGSFLKN